MDTKQNGQRNLTVIAVDRPTLYRLNRFKGQLQMFQDKHVTQAEAINFLLNNIKLQETAPDSEQEREYA